MEKSTEKQTEPKGRFRVTPLRDRFAIQWNTRRPMPPYARSFCEALAKYMREVLPITQPSVGKSAAARKQVAVRKRRSMEG